MAEQRTSELQPSPEIRLYTRLGSLFMSNQELDLEGAPVPPRSVPHNGILYEVRTRLLGHAIVPPLSEDSLITISRQHGIEGGSIAVTFCLVDLAHLPYRRFLFRTTGGVRVGTGDIPQPLPALGYEAMEHILDVSVPIDALQNEQSNIVA